MEAVANVYKFVATNRGRKERFDMILEPLQAILQLSLLSFMPIGTKLMISNNVLYAQPPRWHQPLMRLYNNDNKEDLYFLFHVLIRFTKFYDFMKTSEDEEIRALYELLISLSKKGIDNLIVTYQNSNDYALINILQLYRAILENPQEFRNVDRYSPSSSEGHAVAAAAEAALDHTTVTRDMRDIDKIFVTIKRLYTPHDYHLIYSTLCILRVSETADDVATVIRGFGSIMEVKFAKIHKWISENIIY